MKTLNQIYTETGSQFPFVARHKAYTGLMQVLALYKNVYVVVAEGKNEHSSIPIFFDRLEACWDLHVPEHGKRPLKYLWVVEEIDTGKMKLDSLLLDEEEANARWQAGYIRRRATLKDIEEGV